MTTRNIACLAAAVFALSVVLSPVNAAMSPYVCPGTICSECKYEFIGESKLAADFGQQCDPNGPACNGTLMCCLIAGAYRCTVPVATEPRPGSCPPRPAVLPRVPILHCPQDKPSCIYDSECTGNLKCCMDWTCCGSMPGCQKHECVKGKP